MPAKVLMIQGTGSDVGKSFMTTALCRILADEGLRVAPFKAQNMSNNSYVTDEGGEIGRAQAEQAFACGMTPSVRMNPILIKPATDVGAQLVVMGQAHDVMSATAYRAYKPQLHDTVLQALTSLRAEVDVVVIEGAGSPAEINLRDDDLVNMWIAQQVNAPVLLVGDIDKGGVFAQLVGTMELLTSEERALVRGLIINKFRGDMSILEPGLRLLEERCGVPVLGTIPFAMGIELASEDGFTPEARSVTPDTDALLIDVIRFPRISNFTDCDALAREPDVRVRFLGYPPAGQPADVVILPGTKHTMADLQFLRDRGFDTYLQQHIASGTEVVGICGGLQMLCREIRDPLHVESSRDVTAGLGYLPGVTVFEAEKALAQVTAVHAPSGCTVSGYEIHMGHLHCDAAGEAALGITVRNGASVEEAEGLLSANGQVWGTHVHGLFDAPAFRAWWLNRLRRRRGLPEHTVATATRDVYAHAARVVREHLDMDAIQAMLERA